MKNLRIFILLILLLNVLFACKKVPYTNRKQLALLPESMIVEMGLTNYNEFIKSNKLSTDEQQTLMIRKVGQRISKAAEEFMRMNNMSSDIKNYKWEFNLIESSQVNAWCMPGGKIVFYTGILPYTLDESGIAVVMGHEIAHAIARHGNERLSQQLMVTMGGIALAVALQEKPEETRNLFLAAYGAGATVGILLPYSRKHEYEADRIGMVLMAMAGYDPHEAIKFWERMANASKTKIPEFLSTHPTDENRIQELRKFLPEAMKFYKK